MQELRAQVPPLVDGNDDAFEGAIGTHSADRARVPKRAHSS